jgi:hypothetical protein
MAHNYPFFCNYGHKMQLAVDETGDDTHGRDDVAVGGGGYRRLFRLAFAATAACDGSCVLC